MSDFVSQGKFRDFLISKRYEMDILSKSTIRRILKKEHGK